MDAYVLLQTEPGLATTVMNALVESEVVDRALCITGDADVFARINDIGWPDLKDRLLNKLQRVPGVVRSSTHVVVPTGAVARGPVPLHPVFARIADEKAIYALVFVQVAAGSARDSPACAGRADAGSDEEYGSHPADVFDGLMADAGTGRRAAEHPIEPTIKRPEWSTHVMLRLQEQRAESSA